jgi:hypothetical protein
MSHSWVRRVKIRVKVPRLKEPRIKELVTSQIMGARCKPRGSGSTSIRVMHGAEVFLAEVLVLKGMGVGNMDMLARGEVVELVCGVWIVTDKWLEVELWWGNWEDGEEWVARRRGRQWQSIERWGFNGDEGKRSRSSFGL